MWKEFSLLVFLVFWSPWGNSKPLPFQTIAVGKGELFAFFRTSAISDLCDEQGYFRKCFSVNAAACIHEAKVQLDACQHSVKVPSTFDYSQLEKQAAVIGDCVGRGLEKRWELQAKKSALCITRL